jgi:hypothetical protein
LIQKTSTTFGPRPRTPREGKTNLLTALLNGPPKRPIPRWPSLSPFGHVGSRKLSFAHKTAPFNRHQGPNLHKPHTNWPQTYGVYANPPHPEAEDHNLRHMRFGEHLHKPSPQGGLAPRTKEASRPEIRTLPLQASKTAYKSPSRPGGYLGTRPLVPGDNRVLLDPNPWGVKKGGCYASRPGAVVSRIFRTEV